MNDVVVDTNVFMHADNPKEEFCPAARQLVQSISDSKVVLCLDEGFHTDPAKNKSQIGHEYVGHIRHGSFAFGVILKLVSEQRIRSLTRKVDIRSKRIICQTVRKPVDRIFLCVTMNTLERVLVSHDFEDFTHDKRGHFSRELDIRVITAQEVLHRFA